ncbi:SDR family NAD(P)-dependent oxidoreductase [Leptospira semungkisensis]|uniref:SDR family NAD(P)-dependent oxidoreductase n=1 Tax=Leptospira semungkisensis TaxID=2484985 RepID=A0A4R9G5D4_9LEPT|nr:SDR family oxidoreductase [Leptospira semungkisensis]TGK06742.1 SDR family NAD(P)-dependent oxidoreductase [Leptospira semungkisensis]
MHQKRLEGKVALVAGGTRGAGRGIAIALGGEGAKVYVTGRSSNGTFSEMERKETIEGTAALVNQAGGVGISVRTDHTDQEQVRSLVQKISEENDGKLDILINDVWGGDHLMQWGNKFWEQDLQKALRMFNNCLQSHLITAYYASPLLVKNGSGLLVEITDGIDYRYRGDLAYSLTKSSVINLAVCLSEELKSSGVAALALTPGFLRSEAMLDYFGVTEENWKDGAKKDEHFIASETPAFVGKAVACLASDPNILQKTGKAWSSWKLSDEYGFTDSDGTRPHWGNYFKEKFGEDLN